MTVNISKTFLSELPIKESSSKHNEIKKLVQTILATDKSDVKKIQDLETQINKAVYEIYGLTKNEIEIIEESVK